MKKPKDSTRPVPTAESREKLSPDREAAKEDVAESTGQIRVDPEKFDSGADIIQRVVTDPAFRERVKSEPVEMLEQMGITLSPEQAEVMRCAVAKNPDYLVDIVAAEKFPDVGLGDQVHVLVGVVIAIAAGTSGRVDSACEFQVVPREKVARAFIKQLFAGCKV